MEKRGFTTVEQMCGHMIEAKPKIAISSVAYLQPYRDNSYRIALWVADKFYRELPFDKRCTYFTLAKEQNSSNQLYIQQHMLCVDLAHRIQANPGLLLLWLNHFDYFLTDDHELYTLLKQLNISCQLLLPDEFQVLDQLDLNQRPRQPELPGTIQIGPIESTLCKHGRFYYNRNDIYIGDALRRYGEYSEGEITLFAKFIKPGMTVIEVGSNIGSHTVPLAKMVGPKGKVYAFEPQRLVHQLLTTNITVNNLMHVVIFNRAVGDTRSSIALRELSPYEPNNMGGFELEMHQGGTHIVEQVTLDSLSIPRCDFLKIDAEGMEPSILNGAIELITRDRPIIYLEVDRPRQAEYSIDFLVRLGYEFRSHKPPFYNPNNFRNNSDNVLGSGVSKNMLCLPLSYS